MLVEYSAKGEIVVPSEMESRVAAVRRFNRFITREIGALREGLLHSPYSLTEARIIFELANRADLTASTLAKELGLDPGYLSRTLSRFEQQGLLQRVRAEHDARQLLLHLTEQGRAAFALLDQRSRHEVTEMLSALDEEAQQRLLQAMQTIEAVLAHQPFEFSQPFFLRSFQPGDMGWVIHRHGLLYAQEYGWNAEFEALVAGIVAEFIQRFDPATERCWIAEMNGAIVGSVFLVRVDEQTCKLRLLLVEPQARGMGLGGRLVEECIRFARRVGYRRMVLWTNSVLLAARRIYARAGFRLIESEAYQGFGQDLVGETWELTL